MTILLRHVEHMVMVNGRYATRYVFVSRHVLHLFLISRAGVIYRSIVYIEFGSLITCSA